MKCKAQNREDALVKRGLQSHLRDTIPRRTVLKMAAATLAGSSLPSRAQAQAGRPKRVIIVGAGIAGLSCAYELMRRGHEVVVLEGSGRTGGHILTVRDYLADGLYVDAGAENFTKPGYDRCWDYIHEFQFTPIRLSKHEGVNRRINAKWYTEEMLRDRSVLRKLGFEPAEISYLVRSSRWNISRFYLEPYLDSFEDEYTPFEAGLNHLDQITVADLLRKDGASAAALRFAGSTKSALCAAWDEATWRLQGASEREVYRLKGGNQLLTDALTSRLGDRIWRGCPVTRIEQGETGITAYYEEFGRKEEKMDADYLVSCISLPMLSQVQVSPNWSEAKHYAIHHVPYYSRTRVIFQSRSRFWKEDGLTPNFVFGDAHLSAVWEMGEDVGTSRGLLVGTAGGAGSAEAALKAFRRHYPGKAENIEEARMVAWPLNRWAAFCERILFDPGEMPKIWPVLIEPHGRMFFAGAYAYTGRGRGMDAATRSAHRVAEAIDQA